MKSVRGEAEFEAVVTPQEYGLWALHALEDAKALHSRWVPNSDLRKLTADERKVWNRERHDLERHATTAVLFSALAVEAFLNTYGVVRLGSEYYHSNCERLRPAEKVSAIVLAISGQLLESTDEILKVTQILFDARNGAAHPKTKELGWDKAQQEFKRAMGTVDDGGLARAIASTNAMTTFFHEFYAIAPESMRWVNDRVWKGDPT